MKQYIKLSFFLIMAALFIAGCGDNEETDNTIDDEETNDQETEEVVEEQPEEETDSSEENDATEEDEESEDSSESDSDNDSVSHQEGLKIGETGTVVDNNRSYEITLNSVEYKDNVAGLDASEDMYAVVDMTVTNTDDSPFDAKDIYGPAFGTGSDLTATLNPVLLDHEDRVDEDILQGEIAPGEEVTGVHVFDIKQNDAYVLAIGGSGAQIITYAQWEVSDSEIE